MMWLFLTGLVLISMGALLFVFLRHAGAGERVAAAVVVTGCAALAASAVTVLLTGESPALTVPSTLPGGAWVIGLDALSAAFLLIIATVGAAGAWFGQSYLAPERGHRAVWFAHAMFALLLVAMALVVAAQAVFPFLCAWELMSIGSYLTIVTERDDPRVRRAGLLFLVVTHAGTLALIVMFALWTQAGSDWTFASMAAYAAAGPGAMRAILLLALVGFGVKAGAFPAHFWLPAAHAAAPAHVSALMSGVVIKMGIYGLLRVTALAGPLPEWWGWVLLGLGGASALLGVLWALAQHDLKRLLAYHSVENIGIILMGVGVGALGSASGHPAIAILGYGAAVLHTVNHALFKSVLFFGAGSVLQATGTRHLESLGGLARRMPLVTLAFVTGATAIIGVPPLNGFVSEWLVFQALVRAGTGHGHLRVAVLGVPVLALVGGLALACFAKVVGVVFLGHPRTPEATAAREAPRSQLAPALALAAVCALIGIAAGAVVPRALIVGAEVAHEPAVTAGLEAAQMAGASQLSVFALLVVLALIVVWAGRGLLLRGRPVRAEPTWGCAYPATTPRMQYTASSFAAPLVALFSPVSAVREHYGATRFQTSAFDPVLERGVHPVWKRAQAAAMRLRAIQDGRLHVYLLYVVVALVGALVYLLLGPT
jgi:hydrogenase-4 component B